MWIDATFYKWRSKYGGMEASDAKRLKALEEEGTPVVEVCRRAGISVSGVFLTPWRGNSMAGDHRSGLVCGR
ncbi:MAG: hypothetical protein CMH45_09135 [Muricauda sp.]|nr:hypothetical protein [Allomuricauda sp.]